MDLTLKDLRAIEIWKKYQQHNLAESLAEYHQLVDTLMYLHQVLSEKGVRIKDWKKLSEVILNKFYLHSLTFHNILCGLTLRSTYYDKQLSGVQVIDISSAKVVFRAQLESFLMYHHIYVNPSTEDLKELRYHAWIYSSLLQRAAFPETTEFAKEVKQKDKKAMDGIITRMKELEAFKRLSEKQRKGLKAEPENSLCDGTTF